MRQQKQSGDLDRQPCGSVMHEVLDIRPSSVTPVPNPAECTPIRPQKAEEVRARVELVVPSGDVPVSAR